MDSLSITDVPVTRRERVEEIVKQVESGPLEYLKFKGKRLIAQRQNDIVAVPVGNGTDSLRVLFHVNEGGQPKLRAILTHQKYDRVAHGNQTAFFERLKSGVNLAAPKAYETAQANGHDHAADSEEIRVERPVSDVIRKWIKDSRIGFLFTKNDLLDNRPFLKEEKYQAAVNSCLHDFKQAGYIEDTGDRLGNDTYKLTVYRITQAGLDMPDGPMQAQTISGQILAWLKSQELGSAVTRADIRTGMNLSKKRDANLSNVLSVLKAKRLLPVVGHEARGGTGRSAGGKRLEKYQITQALMDYWPNTPGDNRRKNTNGAETSQPESIVSARNPHQIIAHIHRELHELKLLMKEKVQVAKIHVAKLKTERVKKLTDYSAAELTAALTKVLKAK